MIQGKLKWVLILTVVFVIHMSNASAAPLADKVASDSFSGLFDCANKVSKTFGAAGGKQTRWELCFTVEPDTVKPNHGLTIQKAFFSTSRDEKPIKILHDARVAELFVPYHDASRRFFDVSVFFERNLPLNNTDCPSSLGKIIGNGKVCREVRDRGIAWKKDEQGRRGKELVLWSVLDAFNYNYIIEWAFHDDGTIVGRVGTTGPRNGVGIPAGEVGHMHTVSWRLDIDLDGAGGDLVNHKIHIEPCEGDPRKACDEATLISTETGVLWNATQFTTLDIRDSSLVNGNGRPTSYELIPIRTGKARHFGGNCTSDPNPDCTEYTQRDFWVTKFNGSEILAKNLPTYLNGESVVDTDVVVWYSGAAHHENNMRDEDQQTVPVKSIGFELSPQNLFDGTPFFP